ncbi:MAG TPA: hypothetical protein VGJ55_14340, partial [Pyrinomonadaceae bacterium]
CNTTHPLPRGGTDLTGTAPCITSWDRLWLMATRKLTHELPTLLINQPSGIFCRNRIVRWAFRLTMKIKSTLLSLLLLAGSLSMMVLAQPFVMAQVDAKPDGAAPPKTQEDKEKELERRRELDRKTLSLLDEIAGGAWSLKLPENRSFVLAATADLFWERDEKRARTIFWQALDNLNMANPPAPQTGARATAASKAQSPNQYFATFALRQGFLRKVARRDPQLALDMLHGTRLLPPEPANVKYHLPDESDLEQEIASEVAARDPRRALQIARESLAKGLTFQLLNLLYQLNEKNHDLGSEFAGDIIDKLHTAKLTTDGSGVQIAIQLLLSSRTPKNVAGENALVGGWRLKLSDEERRDLVELIVDAASEVSANPNLFFSVTQIMPEVEQFAPERVAMLRKKLAEVDRGLNPEQKGWNEYNDLIMKGNAEEMLEAAAAADGERRESLYRQAVVTAVMNGRADRLRESINNQIEDEARKKSLIDALDSEQIGFAAYRGQTEELQKLLPQIRLKEVRARAMAEIAILLEKKGDHDEALKLLDDAQALIKVDLKSETQSDALMMLMLASALVDPPRAFAMVEPIIDRANEEISRLLLLDKVVKSGVVKKGEIMMGQPGLPLEFTVLRYGKGIVALAGADFNRTKAAADRFQRPELRIMARLLIAQALLQQPPPNPVVP